MNDLEKEKGPLPIWFFVGIILAVYGLLVMGNGFVREQSDRVVQVTALSPDIWWGGVMIAAGILFFVIGLRGRGS